MTTFDERERAFEAKFAYDQTIQFRLLARRDKLFAHWAANEMNLPEPGRAELLQAVLHVSDGAGHDDRLLALVAARLAGDGDFPLDAALAAALARCTAEAKAHLLEEPTDAPA